MTELLPHGALLHGSNGELISMWSVADYLILIWAELEGAKYCNTPSPQKLTQIILIQFIVKLEISIAQYHENQKNYETTS